MAYLARRYPDRRFITVSPGATTGTEASSNGLALPLRIAANYVMPALRISHKLDAGAKRLVDGVIDPTLSSGVFYASSANKLKGPMVDQAEIFPDLANPSFQDHANEAIHRFISDGAPRRSVNGLWARLVSNQRPLACEASALPLSYAPGVEECTPRGRIGNFREASRRFVPGPGRGRPISVQKSE